MKTEQRIVAAFSTVLFVCLGVALTGCNQSGAASQHKEGEKFKTVTPPADYVAERMRLRAQGAQPGPPAVPPGKTAPTAAPK